MAFLSFFNEYKSPFVERDVIPRGSISLDCLKKVCLERLLALVLLEKVSLEINEYSVNWLGRVLRALEEKKSSYLLCMGHGASWRELTARHYDRVAFYMLVHAILLKDSREITRWFVRNEVRLFRAQFVNAGSEAQRALLLQRGLACSSVLRTARGNPPLDEVYQVPWSRVPGLVGKRCVSLHAGVAFIGLQHLPELACEAHKQTLLSLLRRARPALGIILLDLRMKELLQFLGTQCQSYVKKPTWLLNEEELDLKLHQLPLAAESFPPCMWRFHQRMCDSVHLRHHARLQYIPFLREIGLSVEDALLYFQNTFLQGMTEKQYMSGRYSYFIRYQYGLEGARRTTNCPSCNTLLIKPRPGPLECHGCPLVSLESAQSLLDSPMCMDIEDCDKKRVLSLCGSGYARKACAAIFSAKHELHEDMLSPKSIQHPVQYYCLSRESCCENSDKDDDPD